MKRLLLAVIVLAAVLIPRPALAYVPVLVAEGQLVDSQGQPIGGADVYLSQFTDESSSYTEPLISQGATGSDGYFALYAPQGSGWTNFDLTAVGSSLEFDTSFSTDWSGSVSLGTLSPSQSLGAGPINPDLPICIPLVTTVAQSDAQTTVGELHVWSDETGTFTYGSTADSYIDVGFSTDGTYYSVQGTNHVSNSQGNAATWSRGPSWSHLVTSSFHYKKLRYDNPCLPGPTYKIKATSWNTGALDGSSVSSYDNQCNTTYASYHTAWGKNTSWTRSSSSAQHFGGAFTIFGFTAGAQSGFSTWVQSHWNFGGAYNYHWVCGNDAMPGSAHRVFVGPNKN